MVGDDYENLNIIRGDIVHQKMEGLEEIPWITWSGREDVKVLKIGKEL